MEWTFLTAFLSISISQGILQGLLLIKKGYKLHRESFMAGIIVLLVSLLGTHFLLPATGLIHLLPHLLGIIFPSLFLLGPLLFLLVQINLNPKGDYPIYLHCIPSLISVIVLIPYYLLPSTEKIQIAMNYNSGQNSILGTLLFWMSLLHLLFYLLISLKSLRSQGNKKSIKSLLTIYSIFLLLILVEMSINIYSYFSTLPAHIMDKVDILFLSLLLYSIGFRSFFLEAQKKREPYQNKSFTAFEKKELSQVIQSLLESQFYLDPEMKLEKMATISGFHRNQISQYINQELGLSFKDWINQYRLDHFKERIIDEQDQTILILALESGFKSKSTFNDLFRRSYHMTPREYRKKGLKM